MTNAEAIARLGWDDRTYKTRRIRGAKRDKSEQPGPAWPGHPAIYDIPQHFSHDYLVAMTQRENA